MKRPVSLLMAVLALLGLAACMQEPIEESTAGQASEALEGFLSEAATRALYYRCIEQGVDPCDPPPDPWHPLAVYGFCAAVDAVE